MGFLDGILGGGGQTTVTNNATPTLTPEQLANQTKVTDAAKAQFDNTAYYNALNGYTGAKPVGPSATTTQAQQQILGANPALQTLAGQGLGATQFGLSDALNIASNQYVQAQKDASNQQLITKFNSAGGPLSDIRAGAVQAGGYGGSRQGIAEGQAVTGLAQALATANANTDAEAYKTGTNVFNQTLNSMPAIGQSQLLPGQTTAAVGANQEGYTQQQNNYDANKAAWQANSGWGNVNNLANLIYPTVQPGSTQSQTSTTGTSNLQDIGSLMQMAGTAALFL